MWWYPSPPSTAVVSCPASWCLEWTGFWCRTRAASKQDVNRFANLAKYSTRIGVRQYFERLAKISKSLQSLNILYKHFKTFGNLLKHLCYWYAQNIVLTCLRVSRTVLASSTDSFKLRTSSHMALSSLLSNTYAGLPFEGRQRPHSMALFVLIAAAPAGIYWETALHAIPTQLSYPLRWAHCTTAFHTRYNVSQALSTCNANV